MENHETFFSEKRVQDKVITLVEKDEIISDDGEVAETLNTFFANAVASLNIDIPRMFITDTLRVEDPIEEIISKFSNHPSVICINQNTKKGSFSFGKIGICDIEEELKFLNVKKAFMPESIPPKILKEYSEICAMPLLTIVNNGI